MRWFIIYLFFSGVFVDKVTNAAREMHWGPAALYLGCAALCAFNAWDRYRKVSFR